MHKTKEMSKPKRHEAGRGRKTFEEVYGCERFKTSVNMPIKHKKEIKARIKAIIDEYKLK